MKKVWILFYLMNDYNQPERAFETIWWHEPTHDDLKKYGFTEEETKNFRKPNISGTTEYWVESFGE